VPILSAISARRREMVAGEWERDQKRLERSAAVVSRPASRMLRDSERRRSGDGGGVWEERVVRKVWRVGVDVDEGLVGSRALEMSLSTNSSIYLLDDMSWKGTGERTEGSVERHIFWG